MKKLISAVMSVLFAVSALLPVPAVHALGLECVIDGVNAYYWAEKQYAAQIMRGSRVLGFAEDLSDLSLQPGAGIRIFLSPAAFKDSSGETLHRVGIGAVTEAMVNEAGIEVKSKALAGAQALELVDFRYDDDDGAYILVRLEKELVQTKELDFEYQIFLVMDGRKLYGTELTVAGTVSNPVVAVGEDDEYVDLSGGTVALAQSYVKNITVDLGYGVTILSNFFEGSRYYGTIGHEISPQDDLLFELYPEMSEVISLRTIGLKREGRIVSIDLGERYFVYGSQGEYLGSTDGRLPYSPKYYLSSKDLGENIISA